MTIINITPYTIQVRWSNPAKLLTALPAGGNLLFVPVLLLHLV